MRAPLAVDARALADSRYETVAADGSPDPLAQKPNDVTVWPGEIFAAHDSGVTVTVVPDRVTLPDHDWLMAAVVGSWNRSVQVLIAVVPVFLIDVDRQ